MKGEIFGPILPILTYDKLTDSLRDIIRNHDTPLAQYVFTSGSTSRKYNRQLDQILTTIRSGGLIVNDVLMHVALINAPFGGLVNLVMALIMVSFRSEVLLMKELQWNKNWNDFMVKVRYPPYNSNKDNLVRVSQQGYNGKVWFSRTGDVPVAGPGRFFSSWNSFAGVIGLLTEFITNKQ